MSIRPNKISSSDYTILNGTNLIKAGTGVGVVKNSGGDYTISSSSDPTTQDVIGLTAVTGGGGVVTVNLNAYNFDNPPIVALTPVNSSASFGVIADIVSITASNLTIRTFQGSNLSVNLIGLVTLTINSTVPIGGITVNITLVRNDD